MFNRNKIVAIISKEYNINSNDVEKMVNEPLNNEEWDYTLPCFKLKEYVDISPDIIAKELRNKFNYADFEKVKNEGAYLNFYVNKGTFSKNIIKEILSEGKKYGKNIECINKEVFIEVPSLSVTKEFTLTDLVASLIANCVRNLYECQGYSVTKVNYIRDCDIEICKLIVAYKKWGMDNDTDEAWWLYNKFHRELEINKELEYEVIKCLSLLENNYAEVEILRSMFVANKLKVIKQIFGDFKISESCFKIESSLVKKEKEFLKILSNAGKVIEANGTKDILLSEYNCAPFIAYIDNVGYTKAMVRLTAILSDKRSNEYEEVIFIDSKHNESYFKQLLNVISSIGENNRSKYSYYGIGLIKVNERNLNKNEINSYDLVNRKIGCITEMLNKNMADDSTIKGRTIGIYETIFYSLMNSKNRNIIFDYHDQIINHKESFQYIHSIYEKATRLFDNELTIDCEKDYELLISKVDVELVKILAKFKKQLYLAKQELEPGIICKYVLEVVKKLEEYISIYGIIDCDKESLVQAKLELVKAACIIIGNSLSILGIYIMEIE